MMEWASRSSVPADPNDGKGRELRLDIRILRIAGADEAMPIRVDHHVDIVRIVE